MHIERENFTCKKIRAAGINAIGATRSKRKKKNNVVILINAEDSEELKAIRDEFLLSARKAARKQEFGYYIAPVEKKLFKTIKDFVHFCLKIPAGNR